MSNQHINVSVIDAEWPRLKLIVNRDGRVQTTTAQYDLATTSFEPAVKDALRFAVEEVIKSHKGGR